ncbi:hypothetical protein [Leuconostoc citreum]|uniref:hypothetical protein n=1 Tax=Leuconostoc citreum TaxID=33964 RepID=UPI0032DF37BD
MGNEYYFYVSENEREVLLSLKLLDKYLKDNLNNGSTSFSVPLIAFDGISNYKDHIRKFESIHNELLTHTIDYADRTIKFRIVS